MIVKFLTLAMYCQSIYGQSKYFQLNQGGKFMKYIKLLLGIVCLFAFLACGQSEKAEQSTESDVKQPVEMVKETAEEAAGAAAEETEAAAEMVKETAEEAAGAAAEETEAAAEMVKETAEEAAETVKE
jgi:hypothetical protein